ncbi:MAG: transposase [Bacteroidota bacterium]
MKYLFFIGIDISKKTLDFAVRNRKELLFHLKADNSLAGLNQFQKECFARKIDLSQSLICCEHTGVYSQNILTLVIENNFSLWFESSLRIKRSLGLQRGKNDKIDAMRISHYAFRYADQATIWQPERGVISKLRQLVSLRKRLINAKSSLRFLTATSCRTGFVYIKGRNYRRPTLGRNRRVVVTLIEHS